MDPGCRRPAPLASVASTAAVALSALLLAACAEPELPDEPPDVAFEEEDTFEEPDERDELHDQLDDLHATLAAIRDGLEEASEATDLDTAHAAADGALDLLLVDPGTEEASEPLPLLPSETIERTGSTSAPDLLSVTFTLAQDVGGELGRDAAEVMRDPIAGDLGAWQRDAAGMAGLAEQAGTSGTDLSLLESEVLALEGEGPRALAWTHAVRAADELELAQGAAERAIAHVDLMLVAVDDVRGEG